MMKRMFIVGLVVIGVFAAGYKYYIDQKQIELLKDEVLFEFGSTDILSDEVSCYAKGNLNGAYVDFSKVDFCIIGNYKATVNKNDKQLEFMVTVQDTIAPEVMPYANLTFDTYDKVIPQDLVGVDDRSCVSFTFADGTSEKIYETGGMYTEDVIVTDEGDNSTVGEITFTIVADTTNPVIKGISNQTIYTGDKINYLKGVSASDDRDGDLTDSIVVDKSDVNINVPGTYNVVYSVSDKSGNKLEKKSVITVKESSNSLSESGSTSKSSNSSSESGSTSKSSNSSSVSGSTSKSSNSSSVSGSTSKSSGSSSESDSTGFVLKPGGVVKKDKNGDVAASGENNVGTW